MSDQITQAVTYLGQLVGFIPGLQSVIDAIAQQGQQLATAQKQLDDARDELALANAQAADLQKQLDAALHQQPTPPPVQPPVVKGLIVTWTTDGVVRLNATQQPGVQYLLGTRDDDGAPVLPLGSGPVDFPTTVTPNKGVDYGLIVTPIANGVQGSPVETRIQVKLGAPPAVIDPPVTPPPKAPPVQPPTAGLGFATAIGLAGVATFFDGSQVIDPDKGLDHRWEWDFGDGSPIRHGFNAGHVYEQPGRYNVTLTLTPVGGGTPIVIVRTILVAASGRKIVNLKPGDDLAAYNGQADLELVLTQGIYTPTNTLNFGDRSILRGPGSTVNLRTDGFATKLGNRISGITIDFPAGKLPADASGYTLDQIYRGVGHAIYAAGTGTTIDNVTFLNVGYCVNGNRKPVNVLVEDCACPTRGVRDYLGWVQGGGWDFHRCVVADPLVNHCIRAEGDPDGTPVVGFTVEGCTLGNLRGVWKGNDPKGDWVAHNSRFATAYGNTIIGTGADAGGIGSGPLMETFIASNPERCIHTIIENNILDNAPIRLDPGAVSTAIRGNRFRSSTPPSVPNAAAIVVRAGPDRGRSVSDVRISGNVIESGGYWKISSQGTAQGWESDWGVGN